MKKAFIPFLFLTTLPIVLAGPFESIFDFLDSVVRDILGGAVDLLQSNIYVAKLLITLIIVFIIQDEVKNTPFMRRGGEERAASNRISWMVAIVIGIIVFFGIPDQIVRGIFKRDSMIFGMIIGALLIMFGRGESRFSYGLKAAGYWGLTYGLSGLVSQAFSPSSITGFLISIGGLITLISAIYWTWKVGQGLGPRVRMPTSERVARGAERAGKAVRKSAEIPRRFVRGLAGKEKAEREKAERPAIEKPIRIIYNRLFRLLETSLSKLNMRNIPPILNAINRLSFKRVSRPEEFDARKSELIGYLKVVNNSLAYTFKFGKDLLRFLNKNKNTLLILPNADRIIDRIENGSGVLVNTITRYLKEVQPTPRSLRAMTLENKEQLEEQKNLIYQNLNNLILQLNQILRGIVNDCNSLLRLMSRELQS